MAANEKEKLSWILYKRVFEFVGFDWVSIYICIEHVIYCVIMSTGVRRILFREQTMAPSSKHFSLCFCFAYSDVDFSMYQFYLNLYISQEMQKIDVLRKEKRKIEWRRLDISNYVIIVSSTWIYLYSPVFTLLHNILFEKTYSNRSIL